MRRTSRFAVPALLFLMASAGDAGAHNPGAGFGAGTAGPVITIPVLTIPQKQLVAGLRWDYRRFDAFSDAQLSQYAAQGEEVHSMDDQSFLCLSAGYGVAEDLSLAAQIPYVWRRGIREGTVDDAGVPEVHVHGNSEGIVDLALVAQYRFLRQERWSVVLSGAIPVAQNRNGIQDGMPYRIILGIRAGL